MVSTGEPITQSVTIRESSIEAAGADALRSQGFATSTQVTQESDGSSSLRWGMHAFCWMSFKAWTKKESAELCKQHSTVQILSAFVQFTL